MRQATLRAAIAASLGTGLLVLASCSSGGSSGGGAAPAGGGSTTPGATAVGPLYRKALEHDRVAQSEHLYEGLLFNNHVDAQNQVIALGSTADACIWTGLYVAAQAERFVETGSGDALGNLERSMRALHILHDITGTPGYVCRSFGRPPLFNEEPATGQYAGMSWRKRGTQSRDQYTGWMMGVALGFPHITDPALRAAIQDDCRKIADHLMRNRLKLITVENGQDKYHFNLNPDQFIDQITPQDWATVDDFPINLIAQSVPYDPILADAIINARYPPIRSGEALRALMFFKVMAEVTGDPAIEAYYRNELIGNRQFLQVIQDYGTIGDDIFRGNNLHVISDLMRSLGTVVGDILDAYIQARVGFLGPILGPIARAALQPVIDRIMAQLGNVVQSVIAFITNPQNLQAANFTVTGLQLLGQLLQAVGLGQAGQTLANLTGSVAPYLQSDLETARHSLISGVGLNLTHTALWGLLELETDPNVRAVYLDLLERRHDYDKEDRNTYFNFLHGRYSPNGPDQPTIDDGVEQLRRHFGAALAERRDRIVDNSGLPGVVVSPWPDRFGRTGNSAVEPFWVDERAPHHYIWQEDPRKIVSGSAGNEVHYGLGYLVGYWLGRRSGFVDPAW